VGGEGAVAYTLRSIPWVSQEMPADVSIDELQPLARAAADARGAALFPAIVRFVARALGADKALISESDGSRARTLAVLADGATSPNYEYALDDAAAAPGPSGVDLPLTDADGGVLGHLRAWRTHDAPVPAEIRLLCEMLVGRAAAELQLLRENARLRAHNSALRQEIQSDHNFDTIVGSSPALIRVMDDVRRVAVTDATVLICGETGTGKELIARTIHALSARADGPFIKIACATLPADLVAAEVAGHGREGATLFLDEVGALEPDSQAQLLEALRAHEPRAGGLQKPAIRVIAATNRDLRRAVRESRFREDLFYRLDAFPIEVPPLRARAEDIPPLTQFFAQKYATRVGRRVDGVDPDTLAALARYTWPGNVRELETLVERAMVLNTAPQLKIPPEILAVHGSAEYASVASAATGMHRIPALHSMGELDEGENTGLHFVQREHILRVLNATHWVIEGSSGAALKLGMKPATLRHRMKKLGITRAQSPQSS
jgi:transcriptional regulator with GAF, ATPase, and Fis domain